MLDNDLTTENAVLDLIPFVGCKFDRNVLCCIGI